MSNVLATLVAVGFPVFAYSSKKVTPRHWSHCLLYSENAVKIEQGMTYLTVSYVCAVNQYENNYVVTS